MIKVKIKVKDKNQVNSLTKYGNIIFKSPVLNLVALEIREEHLQMLNQDDNILSVEHESEGKLMPISI